MGLFIITKKIKMDNRQATSNIDLYADRNKFA